VGFCVLIALVLFVAAVPAAAQEEGRDRGFYLGIVFLGSSLHVDDEQDGEFRVHDDGGGFLLRTGYSFNRVFSLEVQLGGANHDTSNPQVEARFAVVQICAHYRFSPGNAFRPYVKGGFGGYALFLDTSATDFQFEGGGIPVGGGFDYFFSRHFSLGVDFTHNIIQYNKATVLLEGIDVGFDIDEEGAMTSLGLALAYYF
jgi:hypothetical protein